MTTTTRSQQFQQFLETMLLGLVMAAGIGVLAEPELAWAGFAVAGIYRAAPTGRSCLPRLPSRSAG